MKFVRAFIGFVFMLMSMLLEATSDGMKSLSYASSNVADRFLKD